MRAGEAENLISIYGNLALNVQTTYYSVRQQMWLIRVLEFYIDEIDRMIAFLRHQQIDGEPRASEENIALLKSLRGQWATQLAFTNNLTATLPLLSSLMGLDPSLDWGHMPVEPDVLDFNLSMPVPEYDEIWEVAVSRSPEVKNMLNQLEAAKHNKSAAKYTYLDPATGVNLGYGYTQNIKIKRSLMQVSNIQVQQAKLSLQTSIQSSINNIWDAHEGTPNIRSALEALGFIRRGVEQHLNDDTEPLDIQRVMRYLVYAQSSALSFVNMYYFFYVNKATLERFTWTGDAYEYVKQYLMEQLPKSLKEVEKSASFRTAMKSKWQRTLHQETEPDINTVVRDAEVRNDSKRRSSVKNRVRGARHGRQGREARVAEQFSIYDTNYGKYEVQRSYNTPPRMKTYEQQLVQQRNERIQQAYQVQAPIPMADTGEPTL